MSTEDPLVEGQEEAGATEAPAEPAADGAGDPAGESIPDVDVEATTAPTTAPTEVTEVSEEAIVALIAERDEYLDALQRLKAEFSNARRRADEQASSQRQQAAADLVTKLLPVLDSAQAALDQGVEEVRPLSDALLEVLSSQGLTRLDPVGEPFNPEVHEAVLFESGEGEQVVVETMRHGYAWNERVVRAAMVKVRG